MRVMALAVVFFACNGGAPVIDSGADSAVDTSSTPIPRGPYHPQGWADPAMHGLEAVTQRQDCRTCHGADLTGGVVGTVSCDSCHTEGWRTDCTYCHGGGESNTGAPPQDLFEPARFSKHSSHLSLGNHAAWDCEQCHKKPVDVLSEGHWFDATPEAAEVDFSRGHSAAGLYNAATGCSNLYCHGDGNRRLGSVNEQSGAQTCASCHADETRWSEWNTMSGQHARHLSEGLKCFECHGDEVNEAKQIINPALHVNAQVESQMPTGMTRSNGGCSGICHFKIHFGNSW